MASYRRVSSVLVAGVLLGLLAAVVHFSAPRTLAEGQLSRLVGGKWFDRGGGQEAMFEADFKCEDEASFKCDEPHPACPNAGQEECDVAPCNRCKSGTLYRGCKGPGPGCTWAALPIPPGQKGVCDTVRQGNCKYSATPEEPNVLRCWCNPMNLNDNGVDCLLILPKRHHCT